MLCQSSFSCWRFGLESVAFVDWSLLGLDMLRVLKVAKTFVSVPFGQLGLLDFFPRHPLT